MSQRQHLSLLTILLLGTSAPSWADDAPQQVGDCTTTTIADVGTRLENTPGSGSTVSFENGVDQVGYDTIPAIDQSHVGDPVRICLVSVPQNCPTGDDRGRVYRTTNMRTHQTWELANSSHTCGGA